MILSGLGPVVLIVGGLALAAILYGLQRLRVQRQVVRVATTLFWQAAAQAAPPRVLHERFRRWLAFLLILAIAWSLWFASARPILTPAPGTRAEIFYLDASAAMTAGGRFAEARRALIADASAVPAERRAVYLGDAFGTRLLAPGEDIALLPRRLASVQPTAIPARFGAWARARRAETVPAVLHYFGSAATLAAAHDPHVVQGYVAPPIPGNRGIVAIGAVPAASGAWDKADLMVRVAAAGRTAPSAPPVFTRNGHAFYPKLDQPEPGRFLLRDLPADGSLIEARLLGSDGFAADDRALLRLPDCHRIRVAILPGVPAPIRSAVAADAALQPVAVPQAEVVIRAATDPASPGKPALVLQPAAAQSAAFRFAYAAGTPQPDLENALDQLGLGQFDAGALADSLHRPVSVEMAEGPMRSVSVWRELFDPAGSFARSQSLPLFVAQSVRWLASPTPWIAQASAGGSLVPLDDALTDSPALATQRLGGAIALDQPGDTRIAGVPVAVTLADPATTLGTDATVPADSPHDARTLVPLDLPFTLALIAAALLLAGEWVLFQRGRLP